MRKITGSEKQIKWANDIINRRIVEVETEIAMIKKHNPIKTDIPERWNTLELIREGLAKRSQIAEQTKNKISGLENLKTKLENIELSARDIIDYFDSNNLINLYNAKYPSIVFSKLGIKI